MTELRVGVRRALPIDGFKDAVSYVVGEMVDNLVSDCDRAGAEPSWESLFVGVGADDTFPGSLVVRASMKCEVNLTELVERAAKNNV